MDTRHARCSLLMLEQLKCDKILFLIYQEFSNALNLVGDIYHIYSEMMIVQCRPYAVVLSCLVNILVKNRTRKLVHEVI